MTRRHLAPRHRRVVNTDWPAQDFEQTVRSVDVTRLGLPAGERGQRATRTDPRRPRACRCALARLRLPPAEGIAAPELRRRGPGPAPALPPGHRRDRPCRRNFVRCVIAIVTSSRRTADRSASSRDARRARRRSATAGCKARRGASPFDPFSGLCSVASRSRPSRKRA